MHDLIPLNLLHAGQTALIAKLMGDSDQVHRMEELGVRQGTKIEMLQPGSPCIVRLSGSKLCFRHNEALSVLVRIGDAT